MGRKPHPLLFQYYTRGAKVPDASNRYEYTCNFCSKVFPKGRPDTLSNHLTRYCQTIPDHERAALVAHGSLTLGRTRPQQEHQITSTSQQPLLAFGENEFHGLDALANASLAQPSAYPDLEELVTRGQHLNDNATANTTSFQAAIDPQIIPPTGINNIPDYQSFPSDLAMPNTSSEVPSALVLNADPFRQISSAASPSDETQGSVLMFSLDEGHRQKVRKVRGAFSEERKREVDATRKSGACIRCRCLNKTCGLADPCDQCQRVSKASTWQYGCIRVKYGQIFHLFHSTPFESIASRVIGDPAYDGHGDLDTTVSIRISCLGIKSALLSLTTSSIEDDTGSRSYIIREEQDTLQQNLTIFLHQIRPFILDDAKSNAIRNALQAMEDLAFLEDKADAHLQSISRLWMINYLLSIPESRWAFEIEDCIEENARHATPTEAKSSAPFHALFLQLRSALEASIDPQILIKLDRRLGDSKEKRKVNLFFAVLTVLSAAEFRIWQMQKLHQDVNQSASLGYEWPLPNTLETCIDQGDRLAELYNIWTDCRHIIPSMIDRDGTIQVADTDTDERIKQWFTNSDLSREFLEAGSRAQFDSGNLWSNDGSLWARLFLEKNPERSREKVLAS